MHESAQDVVRLAWDDRTIELETAWVGERDSRLRPVVFLPEGLGSVSAGRGFADRFCRANGLRGLVWSRYGYGRSTPRPPEERWAPDFMHRQAHEVLPALLEALKVERPWLFGHSDGGSIALLHAARHPVAGLVVVAPHVFVEDVSVTSIEA